MFRFTTMLATALIGLSAVAGVRSASPPPTQFMFTMFFDGGNAYVSSATAPKELTVGAITPGDPPDNFNQHRMRLELENGDWDPKVSTLAPFEMPTTPYKFWDTHGWEIEVCPGGACPTAGSLETSPAKQSYGDCEDASNNFALIPNFKLMHPGKVLRPNWKDLLDSRLIMREGTLRVDSAKSCFDLRVPSSTSTSTINVAGGPKEIIWHLPVAASYVELKLKPLHGGAPRLIRLTPPTVFTGGQPEIQMHMNTFQKYPDPTIGAELHHFRQFYTLFPDDAIKPEEQFVLITKQLSRGATPGTECPPAYLGAP